MRVSYDIPYPQKYNDSGNMLWSVEEIITNTLGVALVPRGPPYLMPTLPFALHGFRHVNDRKKFDKLLIKFTIKQEDDNYNNAKKKMIKLALVGLESIWSEYGKQETDAYANIKISDDS